MYDSISPVPFKHYVDGSQYDFYISPERIIEYIPVIEIDTLLVVINVRTLTHLPWSGDARFHRTVASGALPVKGGEFAADNWPGSDNAHIAL